jgi:O-antigen ligase
MGISRSNVYFYLLILLACSIIISKPHSITAFSYISSKCIAVLILYYLIDKAIIKKFALAFSNKYIWPWLLHFLVYVLGSFWAINKHDAATTIEKKWGLIIFPLILAGSIRLNSKQINKLFLFFTLTLTLVCIGLEAIAFYQYLLANKGNFHYLIYELLASPIMHPGYFSNFVLIALLWLTAPFVSSAMQRILPLYLHISIVIFLFIFLMQLMSKTAFVFIVIFFIALIFKLFFIKSSIKYKTTLVTCAILTLLSFFFFANTVLKDRVKEALVLTSIKPSDVLFAQSIGSRRAAFVVGTDTTRLHSIMGFGTGAANTVLMQAFKNRGYSDLVKYNMHTHNQYLHTYMDTGLIGLLSLLLLLASVLYYCIKHKLFIGIWLTVLVLINCFTDDMLEIQSGIIPFYFFMALFVFGYKNNEPKSI